MYLWYILDPKVFYETFMVEGNMVYVTKSGGI